MLQSKLRVLAVAFIATALAVAPDIKAQTLETETARPLRRGELEVGGGYEFQRSKEGHEIAVPFGFEYGLTNRLNLLVEPVAYTAIRPKVGTQATGAGDLEVTLSYLVANESGARPAIALALEEKIPTARNSLIGTGKPDHAAYIIASKRLGLFDVHSNVSYTIVGVPKGVSVSNRIMGALATEFNWTPSTMLYGEVLASTAAGGGEASSTPIGGVIAPEVSGDEILTTLGIAHTFGGRMRYSLGVTRDNLGAIQVRPGITLWFR